eukprot:254911_1
MSNSLIKIIDSLINTFDKETHTTIIRKKHHHELIINGYIRSIINISNTIPQDIVHLVKIYCPIYHPHCQILFDFTYNNKIYFKSKDLYQSQTNNTNQIKHSEITFQIRGIDFIYNQQYLQFASKSKDDQQHIPFDYKLIQASNNNIDYNKWQLLVNKLASLNIGVNGYIKRCHHNNNGTAVAFDRMNYHVLDLIQSEFYNCELIAIWDVDIDNVICNNCLPSKWCLNIANKLHKNMNIYFESTILTYQKIYFQLIFLAGDENYHRHDLDIADYMELYLMEESIMLCARSRNKQITNLIREIMSFFKWYDSNYDKEKTMDQFFVDLQNEGMYIWTSNRESVECDAEKYLHVLRVMDQISKPWQINITLTAHLSLSRE